ncbi:hypothetical protein P153DRAFT_313432 [Dothidotthia symphoricarpi CBS 119687]|uniref:Uncharacterized protein n=1 Tax=Dothidotthia symphoricarpi CBS 119687 TaxID=1392245 RepID=A0A6A6AJ23_9PLEO|nr:uncharacterized protein P153DRAFT_313432 [Dothidotthia symphoricarpi CBS 119687]KAF2131098.1 hypothetical protein P153DRAFT_313432 [Dothidotthia symphoricarpi CBS 119687]
MSEQTSKAIVYKPPTISKIDRPSVILYGTIESGSTKDWRASLTASLSDLPVAIINPSRDDWDSSWIEDISFPKFKEQVEWEMEHAQVADVIVVYFAPGTCTPIALLELGMYAGTGKVIVCCPKGFYKRGNVEIVCQRYSVKMLETLEELNEKVRVRLLERLG